MNSYRLGEPLPIVLSFHAKLISCLLKYLGTGEVRQGQVTVRLGQEWGGRAFPLYCAAEYRYCVPPTLCSQVHHAACCSEWASRDAHERFNPA